MPSRAAVDGPDVPAWTDAPRGGHAPPRGDRRFWRHLRRNRIAVGSLVVLGGLSLVCAVAPLIAPYDFDAIDLAAIREPPTAEHWLGTDDLGRDLLTRMLYGGRISILIGLVAASLGTGLGSLLGAVAGYYGGRVEEVLMRFTDVMYSIPTLPLLIVLAAIAPGGAGSIALTIGALSWMGPARIVRGEVLRIRALEYIEAARALGLGSGRIIARHVLPNVVGPIVVAGTLTVGEAIIVESSLSFLGLGVQPPTPTWGNMLMDAQSTMATAPWLSIFPGFAILVVVLAVNFLGDGLRDAVDPRSGS